MKLREWVAIILMVLVVGAFGSWVWWHVSTNCKPEPGIRVPLLNGDTVRVKPEDYHKINLLGWAMALDMNSGHERKAVEEALEAECQKDPTLEEKVLKVFERKAYVDAAMNRRRVLIRR